MVNTPSSHKKVVIDHDFRNTYPPGTTLQLFVEGRESPFVCKIDSYMVNHEDKITAWVTLIDLRTEKVKRVFLSMDSHGNIGVYSAEHKKIAIVSHIALPDGNAHKTVRHHGGKVHGVVHGVRKTEEYI